MTLQRLHLMGWQAWAPGLKDKESWCRWLAEPTPLEEITGKPASKRVPAMLRRRCGANARMVMEASLDLCEDLGHDPLDMHIVYGSPNGENHAPA